MSFDTGTIVIVAAVLIFYLRLIIIQREKARRLRQPAPTKVKGKKKKGTAHRPDLYSQISILSRKPLHWIIAGSGAIAILAGVLLYRQIIPGGLLNAYWWLPVALGIVAFSWAFE